MFVTFIISSISRGFGNLSRLSCFYLGSCIQEFFSLNWLEHHFLEHWTNSNMYISRWSNFEWSNIELRSLLNPPLYYFIFQSFFKPKIGCSSINNWICSSQSMPKKICSVRDLEVLVRDLLDTFVFAWWSKNYVWKNGIQFITTKSDFWMSANLIAQFWKLFYSKLQRNVQVWKEWIRSCSSLKHFTALQHVPKECVYLQCIWKMTRWKKFLMQKFLIA